MKKPSYESAKNLTVLFSFIAITLFSQNYTWVRGSNVSGLAGVYGTLGTPSPANDPGGRHGSGKWVDAAGNLWLFGGEGYSSVNTLSWLSDLWKYDISTNQWTWIKGSNLANQMGTYGTMGVSLPGNNPGAREFSICWVDNSGNFWMFGGDGFSTTSTFGRLSDLWKYNPTTNEWTWINGNTALNQNGTYGTLGLTSPLNSPGARLGAASWVDATGNFWMWGGRGFPASGPGVFLNDLWKYDSGTNEWTWMSGSNITNQAASFGTLNVTSPSNYPGAKEHPAYWKDEQGSFYLFGGRGSGYFNDLWRYDIAGNSWTWISGANTSNQVGNYGTLGVPSNATVPGARFASAQWKDSHGNFYLFGGSGFSATTLNLLNDLWRFDPCTKQWTWMKGSDTTNQSGVYGSVGVPAITNNPGGRQFNVFWTDFVGKLWLFGGEGMDAASIGINHMNDVWRYDPSFNSDSIAAVPANTLCSGSSAILTVANSFSAIVWYPGPSSTLSIGTGSTYSTPALTAVSSLSFYPYYAQAACLLKPRISVTLTVNPNPAIIMSGTNQACAGSSITLNASGASTYTWNTTATSPTISVVPTGSVYLATVIGSSTAGCQNSAAKSITVLALPNMSIVTTKTVVCINLGQLLTLTVFGANSYTWSTGSNSSTLILTNTTLPWGIRTFSVEGSDLFGCKTSRSIVVNLLICEGVQEWTEGSFSKLYPNPNNGSLNIEVTSNGVEPFIFEIYNYLGQMVFETLLNSERNVLKMGLSSGVYTYRLIQDHKFDSGKLIIE